MISFYKLKVNVIKIIFTDDVDDTHKCEIYGPNKAAIESNTGVNQQFLKSCFVKQLKEGKPQNIYISSGAG